MKKILPFLLLVLTPLFSTQILPDQSKVKILAGDFKDRDTLKARLENGMTVYIISDPSARKSSAALTVRAGSWNEPEEHPGLAHFLEHMLFMGTKSHPDEASFSQMIKQHGGETNAFTEDLYTSYIFAVDNDAFEKAFAHFAEFFTEPLLSTKSASREIEAINQEFQGNLNKDEVRQFMTFKERANPEHPWHRFNFGSKETLSDVQEKELRKWFEENYYPDRMTLVLVSSLDKETLLELAEDAFDKLQKGPPPPPSPDVPLLTDQFQETFTYIEPLANKRTLTLFWHLPEKFAREKEDRPEDLFAYILGHETEGTLLERLRSEGLALDLGSGAYRWDSKHMAFFIQANLTEKGVKNPNTVIRKIFEAINQFKSESFPAYLFDDYQALATLKVEYPQRTTAYKEAYNLIKSIRQYDISAFPENSKLLKSFRPDLMHELVQTLTPTTVHVDLMAPSSETGVKPNQEERWMKVGYTTVPIPKKEIAAWAEALPETPYDLPPKNPFLPKELDYKCEITNENPLLLTPVKLDSPEGSESYFLQDCIYETPKASLFFVFKSPYLSYETAENAALGELFVTLFKQAFASTAYEASLADLSYEMKYSSSGITLTIEGFHGQLIPFFKQIIEQMKDPFKNGEFFENGKSAYSQELQNKDQESPYIQAVRLLRESVFSTFHTPEERLAVIKSLSHEQFSDWHKNLFNTAALDEMLFGNLSKEEAPKFQKVFQETFYPKPYLKRDQFEREYGTLKEGAGPFYLMRPTQAQGTGLLLAIELGKTSPNQEVASELTSTLLATPFFEELRSQQQTAYVIGNTSERIENAAQLLLFILESHTHSPRDLLARIELFFETYLKNLKTSEEAEAQFDSAKKALLSKLQKAPHSLKEARKALTDEAFELQGDFEWHKKKIAALEAMSFADYVDLCYEWLGKENHKRLAFFVVGKTRDNILDYEEAVSPETIRENSHFQ